MLSPSMITNVKGNFWRKSASCLPTSYSSFSPVPVSPMMAKRTDPGLSGRVRTCAASGARLAASKARQAVRLRNRMGHIVDDEVRLDVAQEQVVRDDAVLHFLGQRRQQRQECWREGRQRVGGRKELVHLGDEVGQPLGAVLILLVFAGLLDRVGAHAGFALEQGDALRRGGGSEDGALHRVLARGAV